MAKSGTAVTWHASAPVDVAMGTRPCVLVDFALRVVEATTVATRWCSMSSDADEAAAAWLDAFLRKTGGWAIETRVRQAAPGCGIGPRALERAVQAIAVRVVAPDRPRRTPAVALTEVAAGFEPWSGPEPREPEAEQRAEPKPVAPPKSKKSEWAWGDGAILLCRRGDLVTDFTAWPSLAAARDASVALSPCGPRCMGDHQVIYRDANDLIRVRRAPANRVARHG